MMSPVTCERTGSFDLLADEKRLLQKRQNEQLLIYLFIAAALVTCWLLGMCQFSFFWVFVISFITFYIWKSKVLLLTEQFLRHCEQLVHRKRALSQCETAEWLNYIVNRWYAKDYYLVSIYFWLYENNNYNFAFSALDTVGFYRATQSARYLL